MLKHLHETHLRLDQRATPCLSIESSIESSIERSNRIEYESKSAKALEQIAERERRSVA